MRTFAWLASIRFSATVCTATAGISTASVSGTKPPASIWLRSSTVWTSSRSPAPLAFMSPA